MITTQTKAMTVKEKPFYKAEDLAEMLEVNIMTIYRYIKAGRLKAYKIGREFRIEKSEFQSFLKKVSTK
jgi:excisionase family DNA binding protein